MTGTASLAVAVGGCNLLIGKEQDSADARSINSNPVNPQQALKLLLDGNQRFVHRTPKYYNQSRQRLQSKLANSHILTSTSFNSYFIR